jgi:type II secretory pathway component PulL
MRENLMLRSLVSALIACGVVNLAVAAEQQEESEIKFAFYSSAWGENTDDGLRLVAYNQTGNPIRIDTITFNKPSEEARPVILSTDLDVPAMGYADKEFEYIDLLAGDECIERTMAGNWRLVEVSNYTLNPSVRNLIIENTDAFRIYQCVENVTATWTDLESKISSKNEEWVLFHFESRIDQ